MPYPIIKFKCIHCISEFDRYEDAIKHETEMKITRDRPFKYHIGDKIRINRQVELNNPKGVYAYIINAHFNSEHVKWYDVIIPKQIDIPFTRKIDCSEDELELLDADRESFCIKKSEKSWECD